MTNLKESSILIIDDNENNLEIIEDFLNKADYKTTISVSNITMAYEVLQKYEIDLILLDMIMPNIDSLDVAKHLKQEKQTKNFPIILLTSKNDTNTILDIKDIEINNYIKKPIINDKELLFKVKNGLFLKSKIDELKKSNKER